MNPTQQLVAQQYARAFLNVFGTTFSGNDFYAFGQAAHFLKATKSATIFLKSPVISSEKKRCFRCMH